MAKDIGDSFKLIISTCRQTAPKIQQASRGHNNGGEMFVRADLARWVKQARGGEDPRFRDMLRLYQIKPVRRDIATADTGSDP